jgi:hypothetical protein
MLECYFDDSSDEKRERYCASGGVIGSLEQWDFFTALWSHEVHGLAKPFRSTECECGHGQFKGWPKERRDGLMARLVDVIRRTKLAGFASIVPVQAYKEAFPASKDGDAYLLTIPHAIMNMAFIASQIKTDLNIWFEGGASDSAVVESFRSVQRMDWKPSSRLRGVAIGSKDLYPLQSADLVAREAFKHIDNLGLRASRKPLKALQRRVCFIVWTAETLQYLARNGGPSNLELLAGWDGIKDAPKLAQFWREF